MRQERRGGEQVLAAAELGPETGQEVIGVRRNDSADLERDHHGVHEQRHADHAEGGQLGRHGEEVELDLLATSVLHRRVRERHCEALEEEVIIQEDAVEGLGAGELAAMLGISRRADAAQEVVKSRFDEKPPEWYRDVGRIKTTRAHGRVVHESSTSHHSYTANQPLKANDGRPKCSGILPRFQESL